MYKTNIPQLFANETSSISESADIAPDMNSCMQKPDNDCNIISQSSVAPEYATEKTNNIGKLLSGDVAVSPPERTYDKACNSGNFHSDDVAVSLNMSPMDPLCSVVPCSFTSTSASRHVSQNCNQQVNLEKHLGPTAEPNLDNPKTQSEERSVSKVNGEGEGSPPTIRRQVASLKTYSVLHPTCDPYIDKEQARVESFPLEHSPNVVTCVKKIAALDSRDDNNGHNQTTNGDKELTSQTEKEMNSPTKVSGKVEASCTSYLVPMRKRVRFSEPEICYPQVKKLPQIRLKDPLVASRICRSSNLKPKSRDKKMIFQDLKFLLTGFSVKKHKQIKNLIQKNGGVVLDDIPCSTSRAKRCSKLAVILCPGRLLTTKFLYGCAVNACILKVKWLFDSLEKDSLLPPKKYMILKEHFCNSCMVIGKPVSRTCFIFDNIAVMLHGKPDFCCKMAKVIKHGGGLVFKTFHWLVKSLESKKVSIGAIVVEDENGISRQLKQCALEQKIPMMPFNWIVNSLYAGRLVPSPELKLPDHLELSEEI